jgi:mono/diheme cytochrome c family protein
MKARWLLPLLAVFLAGCEFSLAGDIAPPPDAIISDAASTPAPLEYPPAAPNAAAGAAIYAQSCAPCHGATGLGDGPQAGALPVSPAPIGSNQLADASGPADWYEMVTQGNLDRFMPPFANQLTVQQRWDVLAYMYSLSADELNLQVGEGVFSEHQAEIESVLPALDDLEAMAAFSRQAIVAEVEPALVSLSSAELIALGEYLQARSLGLASAAAVPQTGAEPASGELGSLAGRVLAGSGGQLPGGLQAILFGYESDVQVYTAAAAVAADGSFDFGEVPLVEGRTYFASVDYLGLSYFSEFVLVGSDPFAFQQPITIYETTNDTDQLAIERLTLIFEFERPGFVRVVQQFLVSNIGDRAVTPTAEGVPVLRYKLPPQASDLVFEQGLLGERYMALEDGFGDLRAVLPGIQSYQLLFAYELPYGSSLDFPLALELPARSVVALVSEGDVSIESADFLPVGQQDIQGLTYQAYSSNGAFLAGESTQLRLRGRNPLGGGGLQSLASDNLIAGLAVLTVAVGAAWLWLHRVQAGPETVLDRIVRLDARYESGKLDKESYERQRDALKAHLQRILKDE